MPLRRSQPCAAHMHNMLALFFLPLALPTCLHSPTPASGGAARHATATAAAAAVAAAGGDPAMDTITAAGAAPRRAPCACPPQWLLWAGPEGCGE